MRTIDPEKHEKRRQQILAAASECFRRDGFRGASISAICAASEMSAGHLYHYFPSKEDILRAIIQKSLMHATASVEALVHSTDPINEFIDQVAQGKQGREDQALSLEMLAEAERNPAVAEIVRGHSREVRKLMVSILDAGQRMGQVDPCLNTEMAATVLLAVIDGAEAMLLRDPKLTKRQRFLHTKLLVSRFLNPQAYAP